MTNGRLTLESVYKAATHPNTASFYLSGPLDMIKTFKNGLKERGVDETRIQIDEWE